MAPGGCQGADNFAVLHQRHGINIYRQPVGTIKNSVRDEIPAFQRRVQAHSLQRNFYPVAGDAGSVGQQKAHALVAVCGCGIRQTFRAFFMILQKDGARMLGHVTDKAQMSCNHGLQRQRTLFADTFERCADAFAQFLLHGMAIEPEAAEQQRCRNKKRNKETEGQRCANHVCASFL